MDDATAGTEALDIMMKILADRYEQLSLWQRTFSDITASNNGAIALKFLQTETLIAMMDEGSVYEAAAGYTYHRPQSNASIKTKDQRRAAISKALSLTPEQEKVFFTVFDKYETERIDALGTDYDIYDLYVGDPTDFTPAFSKRLGRDFIEVMRRENKLKLKYLAGMTRALGPLIAARFAALEDYHSILSKMYVWSTSDEEFLADGSH